MPRRRRIRLRNYARTQAMHALRVCVSRRGRVLLAVVATTFAVLALGAGGVAAGGRSGLSFTKLPSRAVAGKTVTVVVAVPKGNPLCTLRVKYANGVAQQDIRPAPASAGHVRWSWSVPETAQAGVARLSVSCGASGRVGGGMLIVGSLIPPRISVEKRGFSVRVHPYGGSDVSYGVILRNHSPNADAVNVTVLVNFVMADNNLIGSASTNIPLIPAGSDYALGSNLGFPGAAPVDRLEIVIQVAGLVKHTAGHQPALANVAIEPSLYDPGWVGDIAGELINNDSRLFLQSTSFSAVLFDSAGNVVGGGNGYNYGTLPPGTRMVFKLTGGGFNDIPLDKAASVMVTTTPTWKPPSSFGA